MPDKQLITLSNILFYRGKFHAHTADSQCIRLNAHSRDNTMPGNKLIPFQTFSGQPMISSITSQKGSPNEALKM
jgi:hypothetical protein